MTNKTEALFKLTAPYNNPYQGDYRRLLFVCSAGLLRSATGANLYAKKGYNTRNCGTHEYALIPLSMNLLAWAHSIIFVNSENYYDALEKFKGTNGYGELTEKSITLDIPDNFEYNNSKLIEIMEEQLAEYHDKGFRH